MGEKVDELIEIVFLYLFDLLNYMVDWVNSLMMLALTLALVSHSEEPRLVKEAGGDEEWGGEKNEREKTWVPLENHSPGSILVVELRATLHRFLEQHLSVY